MSFVFFKNKIIYFGLGAFNISCFAEQTEANVSDLNLSQRHVLIDESKKTKDIEDSYENGKILIFDNKNENNSKFYKNIMSKASGININNAIVLLKKGKTGPKYVVLPNDITEFEKNAQIEKFENTQIAFESSAPPQNQLKNSSVTITVLKRNLSCTMNMFKGYENYSEYKKDYCDGRAFVELNYKIDMYGSISVKKTDEKTGAVTRTEDGKYLIVTVSPFEEGGTGWHIADEIKQEHLWFSTWAHRYDYTGPFANKYNFWVQNDNNNSNVKLVSTFPQNTNPEMEVTESRGVTIGMKGGLKLGVDKDLSPSGSVDLDISRQVSESRNVSYKTFEFYVENNSYAGDARWTWNGKMNASKICDALTGRDLGGVFGDCYFTRFYYSTDWVIEKEKLKLSAISYNSFTPSFQAIYKASKNEVGKSTFTVGTNAEIATILGSVYPIIPFTSMRSWYSAIYDSYTTPDITESFTVDWSSPFFEPEQNVRLQNMNNIRSTKCLSVEKRNMNLNVDIAPVTLEPCQEERAQIWGYDNEEKVFKSRAEKNLCLTLVDDNSFAVSACTFANSQKWILNTEGNIQSYVDNSKLIGIDSAGNLKLFNQDSSEKIKFEAFKARL